MLDLTDTEKGYIAVAGAILFFGSFALPIKLPSVQKARVDAMVFQCYYSLAVFCSMWLLLLIEPFAFTWWGTAGAALWVAGSVLAISAINYIGMAIAQGTWSGITIVVSFAWGAFAFSEVIDNWYLTILGLCMLLVGIGGISMCNKQWKVNGPKFLYLFPCLIPKDVDMLGDETPSIQESEEEEKTTSLEEIDEMELKGSEESSGRKPNLLAGLVCAGALGLLNGTMMVPSSLTPEEDQGIPYAVSFGIGVAIITSLYAPVYFVIQYVRGKGLPQFHVRVAALPGICAGILWNVGNVCSIYATLYLGLTIGFPLTQMALLVGAVWGMVLFKEITRLGAILTFFLSAIVLLGGAMLLSFYG